MGLESATYISQLDNANPLGGDPINQGDDHIRLVKAVLQSQFPNITAAAINATITEFNILAGLLASTAELNIMNGALLSTAELNILNGLVSTTAELNRLQSFVGTINRAVITDASGNLIVSPGVTVTELNILDGLLASTAELNKLNGLLASTSELDTMDGILSTTSELNRLQSYVGTINRALVSDSSGNIVVSPVTVAELNKLDGLTASTADLNKTTGIEANATIDQTNTEIRDAVEAASNSNTFNDADHTKLNGIETAATADQTNTQIRDAVEAASNSNTFNDADHTKLNGIGASPVAKITTVNRGRTNSTFADDTDLAGWNLDAASFYWVEGVILANTSGSVPDFKFRFTFTQTPQNNVLDFINIDAGGGNVIGDTTIALTASTFINLAAFAFRDIKIDGYILTHATLSSVLDFQWAQNTTNASETRVLKGSRIRVTKIS